MGLWRCIAIYIWIGCDIGCHDVISTHSYDLYSQFNLVSCVEYMTDTLAEFFGSTYGMPDTVMHLVQHVFIPPELNLSDYLREAQISGTRH